VIVTRATRLDELVARFNTRDQARFYIERMGGSFGPYQEEHDAYQAATKALRAMLPPELRVHWLDRSFLPTYTFGDDDVVIALGPDGLVVNTAKYLDEQLLIAVNPAPRQIDGVLLPFRVATARNGIVRALSGKRVWADVTMARADLNDGQSLLALNDFFIGARSHVSARYRLKHGQGSEEQSSSGIIVSTGAGSTGWFRSILAGAAGVAEGFARVKHLDRLREGYRFDWESRELKYCVREPFASKTSDASLVFGRIDEVTPLVVESRMPQNGVIFSDGVEEDFLEFNSGAVATIRPAARTLRLVLPG
jgi:hypothetical protein